MTQLSIVPAGDSITSAGAAWRLYVHDRFAGAADPTWPDRAPLVTLGESSDNGGTYIGRVGARVEALLDPILAALQLYATSPHDSPAASPPVAVVLLGGTNNLSGATDATATSTAADALAQWGQTAGKILDGGAALVGVTVPPMTRSSGELAASAAFNVGLRTLLARLAAAGAPVFLADAEPALRAAGMVGPDGVHPTAAGQVAIGQAVYPALAAYAHARATVPAVPPPVLGAPPFTSGPGAGPVAVTPGPLNAQQSGSAASAGFLVGLLALAWFLLAREGR